MKAVSIVSSIMTMLVSAVVGFILGRLTGEHDD